MDKVKIICKKISDQESLTVHEKNVENILNLDNIVIQDVSNISVRDGSLCTIIRHREPHGH